MDLRNYYIEEDLFPSLFTNCLERPYGARRALLTAAGCTTRTVPTESGR